VTLLYDARHILALGLLKTIELFALSALLALSTALAFGMLRVYGPKPVRLACMVLVEILRGVSTVVVLFWLYFALPFLGVSLSADVAAILGLGLVHGAYSSEIVRGALGSITVGQLEAASALGLSRLKAILLIVLPQALLIMLPSLGNAMILLLKGTSLASIITVHELTFQGSLIVTRTLATFTVFTLVLLVYYLLSLLILATFRAAERRLGRWRPQVPAP
jgi:polar amino acid transport system permease protein